MSRYLQILGLSAITGITSIEGLEWIRLHYAFPSQFPMDVIPVMAERPNICKYLDIPVQHATDNMLKIMRRGITRKRTEDLLEKLRSDIPGIALRTTLLPGHPGETESEFEALYDFVRNQRFDRLGVFTYSHEENTHAYSLSDDVPAEVKEQRAAALMELQMGISEEKNAEKLGKTYKVLFDRLEGDHFVGRTESDSPEVDNEVWVDAKNNYVRMGDFANVRITGYGPYDLQGEIVKP
ncbi:MAG: radical SAM protein [Sphingomonadales bacterium]